MPAYVPDRLVPAGSGYPVVAQTDVQGGAWSVSAIAGWQAEIEPRFRSAGMKIVDRATKREYILADDLVTAAQSSADDRLDLIATASMTDLPDGNVRISAPASAFVVDGTVAINGVPVTYTRMRF